jgi:hypothetical protein
MTTATIEVAATIGYQLDQAAMAGGYVCLAPEDGVAPQEHASVMVRSMNPHDMRSSDFPKKVLRRMQGFLIDIVGEEAKVAFVEGGATHEYYLPAKHLKEAGISSENQPFQMDEVAIKTGRGAIIGYEFEPLAKPSDAFPGSFALDAERERKRNLIFKTFGHA